MSESARYRIQVRGYVDLADARRLRGMAIDNTVDKDGDPVALLRGELPDQAALMGVLHTLNDYQLPLLSAEFQPPDGDASPTAAAWHPVQLPDRESP